MSPCIIKRKLWDTVRKLREASCRYPAMDMIICAIVNSTHLLAWVSAGADIGKTNFSVHTGVGAAYNIKSEFHGRLKFCMHKGLLVT